MNFITKFVWRNFNKKDLENFRIGYSLNGYDVINYLKKEGFSENDMLDAGLIAGKNNKNYDINAKRLVFPIFNAFN